MGKNIEVWCALCQMPHPIRPIRAARHQNAYIARQFGNGGAPIRRARQDLQNRNLKSRNAPRQTNSTTITSAQRSSVSPRDFSICLRSATQFLARRRALAPRVPNLALRRPTSHRLKPAIAGNPGKLQNAPAFLIDGNVSMRSWLLTLLFTVAFLGPAVAQEHKKTDDDKPADPDTGESTIEEKTRFPPLLMMQASSDRPANVNHGWLPPRTTPNADEVGALCC